MARRYDQAQLGMMLDERNRQLDEEIGEPMQYFDDNGETIPQEVIDEQTRYLLGGEADAQLGKKTNTPDQSEQSQQTTQHPIVQQPVKQQSSGYSTPTRYFPKSSTKSAEAAERERLHAEERKHERAAQAAGREAAARMRQQLLDSGMYFDDGKGNIKLKKEYRRKYDRLPNGKYIKTGNNTDMRAGMTHSMIEEAGRTAYQTTWNQLLENQNAARLGASAEKTQSIVNQNKLELQEAAQRKAEASTNAAKGNLAIYDGLVAAYKDLTDESNRGRIEEEVRKVWGGKDEQGRDARWMYDDKGRVVGQAAEREVKTGRRFRNGYVARGVIATINDALQERGNNTFRITGIIARQGVDAIGNASGEPIFYVQGIKTDGSNGPGVPFGKRMTLRGLYRMGVENGIAAGNEGAEENVIHDLGDVMGVAKAKSDAVANGEKIVLERMRQEGADRRAEKKLALQEKALKAKEGASGEKVKIPPQMLSALFGKVSDGKDEMGQPINRSLTTKEIMERYALLKDVMEGNKGVSDIVALVGLEGLDDKEKQVLGLSPSQATPSSGYNNTNNAIPEFDPKGKYKAGDKFSRKGVVYEVGKDGQPYRVK